MSRDNVVAELQVIFLRNVLATTLIERCHCPEEAAKYIAKNINIVHTCDTQQVTPLILEIAAVAATRRWASDSMERYCLSIVLGSVNGIVYHDENDDPLHLVLAKTCVEEDDLVLDDDAIDLVIEMIDSGDIGDLVQELRAANPALYALSDAYDSIKSA